MAAIRWATALTHLTQQGVHWRRKRSKLSWEKRDLSPGSHQSGLPTLFLKRGQVACYKHTHTVFMCLCVWDLISWCPSSGFTVVGLAKHSGAQSELLMETIFSFSTLHLHPPEEAVWSTRCGGRPTSSWGFSLALHHPAYDMNTTDAYCDELTDSSTWALM